MNRDHSFIFEIASKYCISDSFVDYDGYSISSKGFLPTVVNIMALHGMALSFIELDKAVVHVIRLVSFLFIYYCGQESLRRNGIALIVNKRV